MLGELGLEQLARRSVQRALLVAPFDRLLERGVDALLAGVLGRRRARRAPGGGSPGRGGRAARRAPVRARRARDRAGRRTNGRSRSPRARRPSRRARRGGRRSTRAARRASRRARCRSGARTWNRGASRSASRAKWRPWPVTPCRQTTAGRAGVAPRADRELHSRGRALPSGSGHELRPALRRGRSRATRSPFPACRSGTCREPVRPSPR